MSVTSISQIKQKIMMLIATYSGMSELIDNKKAEYNQLYKNFILIVMAIFHYQHNEHESRHNLTDLIAEKNIEILNWNDALDFNLKLVADVEDPLNNDFYFRILTFKSVSSNSVKNHQRL